MQHVRFLHVTSLVKILNIFGTPEICLVPTTSPCVLPFLEPRGTCCSENYLHSDSFACSWTSINGLIQHAPSLKKSIWPRCLSAACRIFYLHWDFFFFLSCSMWDLVPSSGVKPGLPAWELEVLAPGPPGKLQHGPFCGWLLSLNILSGRLIVQLHVAVILSYFPIVF